MNNFLFDIPTESPGTFPDYTGSPFGSESLFNENGYVIYIDFERLLAAIRKSSRNKQQFWYRYQDFDSELMIPYRTLINLPKEAEVLTKVSQQIFRELTGKELPIVFPMSKRANKPYKTENAQRKVFLTGLLNTREGYIKIDQENVRFTLKLDVQRQQLQFTDLFLYDEPAKLVQNQGNWAFNISASTFEDYDELCTAEGLGLSEGTVQYIQQRFEEALQQAASNSESPAWLYEVLPGFVFKKREKQLLTADLLTILVSGDVYEDDVNKEAVVLRMLL